MNDMRLFNMPKAIANIAQECVSAGVTPANVTEAVAKGLGLVLAEHYQPEQAAALLRIEAGKIERTVTPGGKTADGRELADLMRKAHEFINTLQVAGFDERTAVSAVATICVERVARTNGAAGAAHWLRRLAGVTDANGDAIERTAQAH